MTGDARVASHDRAPKWTARQVEAIRTVGHNLLVSAAAGSGKTAVLAERCVHLVCDAADPCGVDELLVVTFTRAAAAEMRGRIERTLLARIEPAKRPEGSPPVDAKRVQDQIRVLERAEIGTLHAFCAKVVRRHFSVLGVDPSFVTLDEHEARLLRRETFDRLIERRLAADEDGSLQRFMDGYANSQEANLRPLVLRAYDLSRSTVDPKAWTAETLARLDEAAAAKRLTDSHLGRVLLDELDSHVAGLQGSCARLRRRVKREFPPYLEFVNGLAAVVDDYRDATKAKELKKLAALVAAACDGREAAPQMRNLEGAEKAAKEKIKAEIDSLRKQIDGDQSFLCRICAFGEDQWREGSAAGAAAARVLFSLVDDFEQAYAAAKLRLRALDFTDLERLTLEVLRDPSTPPGEPPRPSAAAREYQAQFRHVLVDEYQDINALQDALLRLLSHEACGGGDGELPPNLFCVGDVKQSIYRFRLADPMRFLERSKAYAAGPKRGEPNRLIPLSENFRSTPAVIDAVNAVFERLMTEATAEIDYDASHALRPGKPAEKYEPLASPGSAVELHLLAAAPRGGSRGKANGHGDGHGADDAEADAEDPQDELDRTEREAAVVAAQIRRLVEGPDGFKHGQIAILLRAMKFKAQQFASMLRRFGIPVHADAGSGFFATHEAQDMLALLRVLDNPLQDIPLAALLRSPLCRIADADDKFARLRIRYSGENYKPFHRAVFAAAADGAVDPVSADLKRVTADLERWRAAAAARPIAGVIWEILQETGYLAYCGALRDGEQRTANLLHLYDLARAFGTFQKQGLRRFLEFLTSLEEESDLGQPNVVSDPGDVVRVMSVHRSKGLQFPVVIVPDLGKDLNLSDTYGAMLIDRDLGVAPQVAELGRRVRYPSLASTVTGVRLGRKLVAEELRVLYVAMTRAQRKLILLGTTRYFDAVDEWQQEWAGHAGPLPPELMTGRGPMLNWLIPAHAAIAAQRPGAIDLFTHDPEAIRQAEEAARKRVEGPKIDEAVLSLQPLPAAKVPAEELQRAQRVLEEMSWRHPMAGYSGVPAARAVTQLTKSGRRAGGGESVSDRAVVRFTRPLRPPAFTTPGRAPLPTEVGVTTHRVLQSMRLATPPTPDAVAAEVQRLVDRKIISAEESKAVDRDAIAWFLATPLGALLRERPEETYRELPIFVPAPASLLPDQPDLPPSDDPLDRTMLRGQIDVMVRVPAGLVVIDYKTDRVTDQTLPDRVEFYRPQVHAYCQAIGRIAGLPVVEAHLVFLVPRRSVPIALSSPAPAAGIGIGIGGGGGGGVP